MDFPGVVASIFIIATFGIGLTYFCKVMMRGRSLRRLDNDFWLWMQSLANSREGDMKTVYKIIINKSLWREMSEKNRRRAALASRLLYTSLTMFMVILVMGLIMSINK